MKKILIFAAAAALLLCSGCGEEAPEPTPTPIAIQTPEPTPVPTPEPPSVPGTVRAGGVTPFYVLLSRGDSISVTGSLENYYLIAYEESTMLVEKHFIRLDSQAAPGAWTGYAKSGATVYDSAFLTGDPIATLELNAVVEVLDKFDGIFYIKSGELSGYIAEELISETETPVYNYYGGGGGGDYSGSYSGGGSAPSGGGGTPSGGGGTPSGGGSTGGQDGGDIALGYHTGEKGGIVLLGEVVASVTMEGKATKPATATVLTDKFPVYLWELKRGDAVKVTQQGDGDWSLLINGKIGTVPSWLIRLDSDEPYTPWNGFARSGAGFYSSYLLYGSSSELIENTILNIVDDLGGCYVAELNGAVGYISHDDVSQTEIVHYNYSGGGSTGGGGGSAPSGGGGGGSVPEWTEPAL